MSNYILKETIDIFIINVLAPGATKKTTKIRILKGQEKDIPSLRIECNPITTPELESVDLNVVEEFDVPLRFDPYHKDVRATVKTGIITVSIPVNTDKVKTIKIDE